MDNEDAQEHMGRDTDVCEVLVSACARLERLQSIHNEMLTCSKLQWLWHALSALFDNAANRVRLCKQDINDCLIAMLKKETGLNYNMTLSIFAPLCAT
jgi:hypothetical protein